MHLSQRVVALAPELFQRREERHEDNGTKAGHLPLVPSSYPHGERDERSVCKAGDEMWLKPNEM